MENKVIKTITSRTSTRSYLPKKVPLKKLEAVLEAGKFAPSAKNRQICHILAIRSGRYVNALHKLSNDVAQRDCFYGANTAILVYGPRDDGFTVQDASCILENMFIAAESLNLGACWMNQMDELLNSKQGIKLRNKLGLNENDYIVGTCLLGYKDKITDIKPRKEDMIKII